MYIRKISDKRSVTMFDSLTEVLDAAENNPFQTQGDTLWAGGTLSDVCRKIRAGVYTSAEDMRNAKELLNKIDTSFRDRMVNTWEPEVAGAYAVVPEFLMGLPEHMRSMQRTDSDVAPIKLCIEVSYSAGVNHDAIMRRGTALAALVMRMMEERPVELILFTGWQLDSCQDYQALWMLKVDTQVMSLQTIMDLIAGRGFARIVNFSATSAIHKAVKGKNIPRGECFDWAGSSAPNGRKEFLREQFGWEQSDIVVERGHLDDAQLMNSDPVAWVHKQLEKQRHVE